jgi:ATP-binding cassette subfamily B protein
LIGLLFFSIASAIFKVRVDFELQELIDSLTSDLNASMASLTVYFIVHKTMHHVVHFLQKLLSAFYNPRILQDISEALYVQVMRHSLQWFDSHLSGEVSSKINDFQDGLLTLLTTSFHVASHLCLILVSLIFLSMFSWQATLVLVVFIAIYTPLMFFFLKRQMALEEDCAIVRQEAFGVINDSISSVFGIKTMGRLSWEFSLKLLPALKKWRNDEAKSRWYHAYYVDTTDTVLVMIMGTVQITLIAYLYRHGLLTAGQFAFTTIATLQVHKDLSELVEKIVLSCNPKIAALKASYSFMTLLPSEQEPAISCTLPVIHGKIQYKNVSFGYGPQDLVLKNLNVTILPGQKIGIVGGSGAGKSTFIKCLLKYFPIAEGTILLDDMDIAGVTQESLCSQITLIPQEVPIFHRSVLQNLRMIQPTASTEDIEAVCKKAHIHGDIMAMKDQYHTILGERGIKLSGGQRQRLSIARAMLKNAPIMILDEATSALDAPTERLIQSALDVMMEETQATTLIISHRMSTFVDMERILVFDKGRIVQDGPHSQLVQEPGSVYKSLWDAQANHF